MSARGFGWCLLMLTIYAAVDKCTRNNLLYRNISTPVICYMTSWCWMRRNAERRAPLERSSDGWAKNQLSERRFKLCMTVYKCLHGMGPIYLSEMCRPSSSEAGCRHLRSVKPWSTRRSPLQANDCWQKGILLCRTVCVEQSSWISDSRHAYLGLF